MSPSKPCRRPAKPSGEQHVRSVDVSHHTTEDTTELATTTNVLPVSCEPRVPTWFHDVVDDGGAGGHDPDPAAVPKRRVVADRGLRARSFPPAGKLPAAVVDDWFSLAPLASPETLSESSSVASCSGSGSAVAGVGYQRIMSSMLPPRMDPILQSPARSWSSQDCCLYLESADVVGDLATLSPCVENLPSPIEPHHSGPDILPASPFIVAGPSDGIYSAAACGSSPDVIRETGSATDAAVLRDSDRQLDADGERYVKSSDLSVERSDGHRNAEVLCTCEHGPCACGNARPDIVCTHEYCGATMHDRVSADC